MKEPLSAGFEPAREDPNGFQVHRLNHSATTTVFDVNCEVKNYVNYASQILSLFTTANIVESEHLIILTF